MEQKPYIDIDEKAQQIHQLLNDDNYDVYEVIGADKKMGETAESRVIILPKHTLRAAVNGDGVFQVINGDIKCHLRSFEILFVRKI